MNENERELARRIGKRLRIARVYEGSKQFDIAKKVGISQTYLSLLEHGHRLPSLGVLARLAAAYGCTFEFYFVPKDSDR